MVPSPGVVRGMYSFLYRVVQSLPSDRFPPWRGSPPPPTNPTTTPPPPSLEASPPKDGAKDNRLKVCEFVGICLFV